MALGKIFERRIQAIRDFLAGEDSSVLLLKCPPDLEQLPNRVLVNLDQEERNPHVFLYTNLGFSDYETDLGALEVELTEAVAPWADELRAIGAPPPDYEALPASSPFDERFQRLGSFVGALRSGWGERVGALCLIVAPEVAPHAEGLAWSLSMLIRGADDLRVKTIVIDVDDTLVPAMFGDLASRVTTLTFALDVGEIERDLRQDLAAGDLSPKDRRSHLLLLGALAASSKKFDEAEVSAREALRLAEEEDAPTEAATAYYNLGNALMQQGRNEEAVEEFERGADLCADHDMDPLLAMTMTNMGLCMARLGCPDEASQLYAAARSIFKSLDLRPAEAHVLDCMASSFAETGDRAEAAAALQEARALYESIEADHMTELRTAGVADIDAKLGRL